MKRHRSTRKLPASVTTSPASTADAPPEIPIDVAVDARCLQDHRFRRRGIGQFVSSLLQGRSAQGYTLRLIGAVDNALPALAEEHAALFDVVRSVPQVGADPAAFLCPSPMTHPALPFARLLRGSRFRAALVHDFIPLDHPEIYLPTEEARAEYAARLAWLPDYDRFYTNSGATHSRLLALSGMDPARAVVSGIPVRRALLEIAGRRRAEREGDQLLVAAGDDWRKNVEAPIAAHARSAILNRSRVRLCVFGGYSSSRQAALRASHAAAGGNPDLLEFAHGVSDAELASLYAGSVATVVPSRNEGFSMPVIEASAFGSPVLAGDCAAHAELLPAQEDRFEPDDIQDLQFKMEMLYVQPAARAAAGARQAGLAARFTSEVVCGRFWDDFGRHLLDHVTARTLAAPQVRRHARPSIGFVTPLPPDRSGVADYSAATLQQLGKLADVHVYTDTQGPATAGLPIKAVERLNAMAWLSGKHDATVAVLGNSHYHLGIFREVMEWGGPCIAHDARMLNFYWELLGEGRTLAAAEAELGRPVKTGEVQRWLADQADLPALFLDEVARASSPMFVHSALTADLVKKRGLDCVLLPFSPYRVLSDEELSPAARRAARRATRIPERRMVVVVFGAVMTDRAILDCMWAIEMLRSWGYDAMLACIGSVEPALDRHLRDMAATLGISDHLFLTPQGVSEAHYRQWLQAADYAIQLRTYGMGGLSGALLDCIAAGLPTVANEHLAAAMSAPPWVHRVPDGISAVLIAEQLANLHSSGAHRNRDLDGRRAMLAERGFPAYARRLLEHLGVEPVEVAA